jgi:NAD(P)-dependent dehydrogenase (short-subunit alcohol dehydrogenase family)
MSKVLFILGAGPRIGWSVAGKFKSKGYKVAVGSRNPNVERATSDGFLPVTVDVTKSESVESAFAKVKGELGVPNVVVYNGMK